MPETTRDALHLRPGLVHVGVVHVRVLDRDHQLLGEHTAAFGDQRCAVTPTGPRTTARPRNSARRQQHLARQQPMFAYVMGAGRAPLVAGAGGRGTAACTWAVRHDEFYLQGACKKRIFFHSSMAVASST